jgi:hypothetical protein
MAVGLGNLVAKISNLAPMLPHEQRQGAHLKRFLHIECVGQDWASPVLSRAAYETDLSFVQLGMNDRSVSYFAGVLQQHVEEQVAKRRLQMRIPPTFPTLYESVKGENQSRQDPHPKYYARSTKHRPDTGISGTSRPGTDRRCRGCGSTEHWIRDGKCDAMDVAAYLQQRLILGENPHKIIA